MKNACFTLGAIPLTDSHHAESKKQSVINSLRCNGTESQLTNCLINEEFSGTCGQFKDAGVICQGTGNISTWKECFISLFTYIDISTRFSYCKTGEVKLIGSMNETARTKEGRVEICVNNAWGTICNDFFDELDAGTVCVRAGGYLRSGT